MISKFALRFVLSIAATAAMAPVTSTSFAAQGVGKITTYHLNGNVAGRGACVQTTPALPGTWGCVWYSNQLYKELNELLREAYFSGKTCTIAWNEDDYFGLHLISVVECD
jgi:hypothetical protein